MYRIFRVLDSGYALIDESGVILYWSGYSLRTDNSFSNINIDNYDEIENTNYAFSVLSDGSVTSFGSSSAGGLYNSPHTQGELYGENGDLTIIDIASVSTAFYAIRSDGTVTQWGSINYSYDDVNELITSNSDTATQLHSLGNKIYIQSENGYVYYWEINGSVVKEEFDSEWLTNKLAESNYAYIDEDGPHMR